MAATVIPNGERHDSKRSCGGGTAAAAAAVDGDNLPGASAAGGRRRARDEGRNDGGMQGRTLTGKGQEPLYMKLDSIIC